MSPLVPSPGASPRPLRIALTADLHWGTRHPSGRLAALELVAHLCERPPDVLVLAGDIGAGDDFGGCLELFAGLDCVKALVPGNHDVWVRSDDARGDSLRVYRSHLPAVARANGFHYLDAGPLILPESDLALVGSMNWYDYSWSINQLPSAAPDWEARLRAKRFTRGRHNDANFVRWPYDDAGFTREVVAAFERHLDEALALVGRAVVVTHHPTFRGLDCPREEPLRLDDLLWMAFSGNTQLEGVLERRAERIDFAFCGHTHFAREGRLGPIRGYNIGGDYHFKRLLWLDWPAGTVEAVEFGL